MRTYIGTLFSQYLRTPYTYIAFLLPILFIVGLGKIIPAGLVIPSSITIGITVSILFLFGGSVQEMRSTSFIKSISLTKLSKSSIVIINMFIASVISVVAIIIILLFSYILDSAGFFAQDFSAFSPDTDILAYLNSTIIWSNIEWFTFIYGAALSAILAFSISYLIISFTKTTNSLYVISFIYVFIMILMGGIIIPTILSILTDSFVQYLNVWIPHYYTNNIMAASMVTDNVVLGEVINNIEDNQIAAFVIDLINGLPSLEEFHWDAIQSDINLVNNFLQTASDPTSWEEFVSYLGTTNPEDAFSSNIFRILTSDLYTVGGENLVSFIVDIADAPLLVNETTVRSVLQQFSLLQVLAFTPEIISETPLLDLSTLTGVLQVLTSNKDVLIQYLHSVTTWDFNSYESIANCFLPIILADIFSVIGIYNFNWTVR